MSTQLEPEQREEAPAGWQVAPEAAPSTMRADEAWLPRLVGMIGFTLVLVGGFFLIMNLRLAGGKELRLGPMTIGFGWSIFFLVLGMGGLLFHAASDGDLQVRRMYLGLGLLWLAMGAVVSLIPTKDQFGANFLPFGVIGFTAGLVFLLAPVRHETEARWRDIVFYTLTGLGVVMALAGLIGSNISVNFLLPYGLLLFLLGLFFWWAGVSLEGVATERGYRLALAMGGLGLVAFLVGLGRSVLPPLLASWEWIEPQPSFLMPSGVLLMTFGALYMALAAGLCSDQPLVVLTRRELASLFFSPIAYILLLGFCVIGWYLCVNFAAIIWPADQSSPFKVPEPILRYYFQLFFIVVSVIFLVPVLTMRLLSEEQRTGTMEVALTAPLGEVAIVFSKFLAAFLFYLLVWVPLGLYLVALRVEGGQPFDYGPLLAFFLAAASTGASLIGMGLFFSSLTRNQLSAAILTFIGILAFIFCYIVKNPMENESSTAYIILSHVSFVDLWENSLQGQLAPRDLFYQLSGAVFWLFLTVKVLESRKWR
jgi:ABC-type transport system involved in multi-copper enzyme maturation permease subunit